MRSELRLVPTDPDSTLARPPLPRPPLPRPRDALAADATAVDVTTVDVPAVEPIGDGTAPHPDECLPCYLERMLDQLRIEGRGCDNTLRWALVWRDARAPRARALDRRLADRGGCCDCEVLVNVYPGHDPGRAGCRGRVGGEATTPCCPPRVGFW